MARDEALTMLKPVLEDDSILKIGQNMKYDAKIFTRHGIDVAPIDDTMLILDEVSGSHFVGAAANVGTRWPMNDGPGNAEAFLGTGHQRPAEDDRRDR